MCYIPSTAHPHTHLLYIANLHHPTPLPTPPQHTDPDAAPSSPALLTVGADGALRLWVEVTLAPPSFPPRPPPPPPPTPPPTPPPISRHFCIALVVELPHAIKTPPGGTMHAAWATPLGCILPTAHWSGLASRVLWLVAVQRPLPGATAHGVVCVWAVESLTAVRGVPGNMQQHQRPPRAVLWGTANMLMGGGDDDGDPHGDGSSVLGGAFLSVMHCYANFDGEVPLLLLYDAHMPSRMIPSSSSPSSSPDHPLVTYTKLTTLQEGVHSPIEACTASDNHIRVCETSTMMTMAHTAPIVTLASHPCADVAVVVDRAGGVVLWGTSPVIPLHVVGVSGGVWGGEVERSVRPSGVGVGSGGLGVADVEAGGWVAPEVRPVVTAACWLVDGGVGDAGVGKPGGEEHAQGVFVLGSAAGLHVWHVAKVMVGMVGMVLF